MNGMIKVAALAALMASGAAFANEDPTQTQQPAGTETQPGAQAAGQWPEFSTIDVNGDGYVSRDEASANATLSGSFSDLDADKNGSLSSSEYEKGKEMHSGSQQPTEDPSSTQDPSTETPPQQ